MSYISILIILASLIKGWHQLLLFVHQNLSFIYYKGDDKCNFVNCLRDPCEDQIKKGCRAYLHAVCVANYCVGCNFDWIFNSQKIDCEDSCINTKCCEKNCRIVRCKINPCDLQSKCDAYPNAVCVPNYCGGCNFDWIFNGKKVEC